MLTQKFIFQPKKYPQIMAHPVSQSMGFIDTCNMIVEEKKVEEEGVVEEVVEELKK